MLQSPEERSRVEQMLGVFSTSTEHIGYLKVSACCCRLPTTAGPPIPGLTSTTYPPPQAILDNSRSPYAQLLASSSLLKLVTDHTLR